MIYPTTYIDFLTFFHGNRDYFECHEVLEEYWKQNGMERKSIWVGFIQVAVTMYHYRRGNLRGAMKMIRKAIQILIDKQDEISKLGLDYDLLIKKLKQSEVNIILQRPYKPLNLPIVHSHLLRLCKDRCAIYGFEWGNKHDPAPYHLVHRHRLQKCAEEKIVNI